MQGENRAKILAAAREEFAERGFREAKIDRIAERAGLTRGAVYSNFPGKRGLYFAVLLDLAERAPRRPPPDDVHSVREALGAFARVWVSRLPLSTDEPTGEARLGRDLIPEIVAEPRIQQTYAQLLKLDALLLALAMERMLPVDAPPTRLTRVAEAVLTTLHGVGQMAAAAPGFVEPFDAVSVCERLADLDLSGGWPPPHTPWISPARPADEPWSPPSALDAVRDVPAPLTGDGVVAILGLHRLQAVEEAVRGAPPGSEVTAVVVTGDRDESGPLARLVVVDLLNHLRESFPRPAWPTLRLVHDETGDVAAAAGVTAVSDATETAVRIVDGRVVARAEGRGACHAAATADQPRDG
ncbi:TetR/AcrR family transcriptional regulator [Thermomonospora umbrina]